MRPSIRSLCFLLALVACALTTESSARAGGFADSATTGPAAWKHYEVRGVQLGVSRKQLVAMGFACGSAANSGCTKFMDDRCKTATCKHVQKMTGDVFTLNGAPTLLDYMTCTTTETESALAYDCLLQIAPRRVLTPDSPFGKALVEKYGPFTKKWDPNPNDKVGGGRLLWWNEHVGNNAPMLNATCESAMSAMDNKPIEPYCFIHVSDDEMTSIERNKQTAIDEQRKRSNQPAAPAL